MTTNQAAESCHKSDGRRIIGRTRRLAASCLLAAFWLDGAVSAFADTHTWTDAAAGNSNWSDGGNWSPAGPPAFGDFVIVPTPGVGVGPVVINVNASPGNMEVGANGSTPQVQIPAGRNLDIVAGDLDNDGLIVVNSDGGTSAARLRFNAFAGDTQLTLFGSGTILLQAGSQTFPTTVSPASVETGSTASLTQAAGHTIRGVGRVAAAMLNHGEIWADDYAAAPGANTLELTAGSITNHGTLGATAGGTLDVIGTYSITQGATGVIVATDGGTVQFRSNVFITDGALQTKGSGIIVTPAGGTTRLTDVLNEGHYRINSNGFTFIAGNGFTNDGLVDLQDSLNYLNTGSLDGDGEIVLSGNGSLETQVGVTINHAAGHTIRGAGQVSATMVNEGVIEANGVLRLISNPMTNHHILRAASGGTLEVGKQVTQDTTSGVIVAEDGGIVKLTGTGNVIDGRLQSFGAGVFHAGDNTQITDVHNQATIELRANQSVARALVGGTVLTNDGAIIVNPTMQSGGTHEIAFCCPAQFTLDGAGYIDLNHTNASLSIAAGTKVTNAAGHTIKGPGIIQGQGELVNNGLVWGGTIAGAVDIVRIGGRLSGTGDLQDVRFTGTHAPGNNGPGSVNADGSYEIATGGRLEIEIGGTVSGTEFDVIHARNILLGGTLDVDLINGFAPAAGNSFAFLTYTGGSSGSFASELLPALPGGLYFDVAYNTGVVSLDVEGVLGDYNHNGIVDAADYVVWRKTYGESGVGLAADGNGDKMIDDADYDVWTASFGQVAPIPGGSPASQTSVPEPHVLVLLLALAIAPWPRRSPA